MICQAKLANKHAVLDPVQGLRKPVRLHPGRAHKLQQYMPLLYLLVDPLIPNVDMLRTCGLEEVEHGQPNVLAVRVDEQRCSLRISGLSADLYDPLDTKGCRRKINELGLNGRDCYNCLFPAFPYDWATG